MEIFSCFQQNGNKCFELANPDLMKVIQVAKAPPQQENHAISMFLCLSFTSMLLFWITSPTWIVNI